MPFQSDLAGDERILHSNVSFKGKSSLEQSLTKRLMLTSHRHCSYIFFTQHHSYLHRWQSLRKAQGRLGPLSFPPPFKPLFCFVPQRQVKMKYLNRISELLMALKLYTSCMRFTCPSGRGAWEQNKEVSSILSTGFLGRKKGAGES